MRIIANSPVSMGKAFTLALLLAKIPLSTWRGCAVVAKIRGLLAARNSFIFVTASFELVQADSPGSITTGMAAVSVVNGRDRCSGGIAVRAKASIAGIGPLSLV